MSTPGVTMTTTATARNGPRCTPPNDRGAGHPGQRPLVGARLLAEVAISSQGSGSPAVYFDGGRIRAGGPAHCAPFFALPAFSRPAPPSSAVLAACLLDRRLPARERATKPCPHRSARSQQPNLPRDPLAHRFHPLLHVEGREPRRVDATERCWDVTLEYLRADVVDGEIVAASQRRRILGYLELLVAVVAEQQ